MGSSQQDWQDMEKQEERPLTMELRTEINYLAKLAIGSGIAEVVRRKCLRLIDEIEDEQEEK